MTGKEVAIVLGGAALFGGAAGAGAAAIGGGDPPAPPPLPDTSALERRLEDLEASLRDTRRERDELREAVASLRAAVESAPATPSADASPAERATPDATLRGTSDGKGQVAARLVRALAADGRLHADGPVVVGEIGEDGLEGALPEKVRAAALEEVNGLMQGIGRRGLPEADRWKKACEEVGVSDVQVEELKAAVAERDRALEDAFVTEKSEGDGEGGSFTLRRLDQEKAAAANREYSDRLDRTLTADQRSKWKSGGWDHSFGRLPGGGSGAVMTIEADSVWHGEVEEEGPR
jgi:hypothetical protein